MVAVLSISAKSEPAGVAVYMRVSSAEQRQQGTIENQRSAAQRYLAAYGIMPYGWYADDGVSGTVPFAQRAEGARLLADAAAKRVQRVICWRLDRIGRNALAILQAVETLERADVMLISITESFDMSTPAGRLSLNMLASIAQYERDSIIQRSDQGTARRLTETSYMGGKAPLGYRVEGKKKDARLVIDDIVDSVTGYSALDAIKLAWHLLVDEGWTCDRICEKFDTIGIPTYSVTNGDPSREWHASPLPGPAKWQDNALRRLLRSSFYAGTLTYRAKDGTLHSHPVPAIFTAEQVEQARDALRRHRRFSHTPQKHAYLLDDLLRCTECGALYTTHWSEHHPTGPHKGERWRYYICATRRYRTDRARLARVAAGELHADCRAPSVDALYAEQQIWADIEYFIRHPAETLALLAAKRSATSEQQDEQRAQLTRMQQALDKLQGERDTVMREYRKERIDDRTKDRQLDEIAEEEAGHIKTRQSLLAALQDTSDEQSRLETARTLLQQLHARLDAGPPTPAVKYDIVHALVREIRVDIKELGLSQRGRLKRRAVLNVTYRFDPPETRALPAAAGDQLCSDQRSPARSSPHN